MGMYTSLVISVKLKNLTNEVQEIFKYLLNDSKDFYERFHKGQSSIIIDGKRDLENLITLMKDRQNLQVVEILEKDKLFHTERWMNLLVKQPNIDIGINSQLIKKNSENLFLLDVNCELKNYHNEIDLFLGFIEPYVSIENNFIGYFQYETNLLPTLIYVKDEKIIFQDLLEHESEVYEILKNIEKNINNENTLKIILDEIKIIIALAEEYRE